MALINLAWEIERRAYDGLGHVSALAGTALAALAHMQDPETGLYAHKTFLSQTHGYVNVGSNPLYSAAVVVGLLAAESVGTVGDVTASTGKTLDALHALASTSSDPGTLAVLVWASTLADDRRCGHVMERMLGMTDPSTASSMELGLGLTAIGHAAKKCTNRTDRLMRSATHFVTELRHRYSPAGQVFRAMGAPRSFRRRLIARMTSFASQVYPVHGLAEHAALLGDDPVYEIAAVCNRLCAAQGSMGQWWWFYGVEEPVTVEAYPVYSVHQDAMAFMALASAERVTGLPYAGHLRLGLEWLHGKNELNTPMVVQEPPFIWRAIQLCGGDPDGIAGWSREQHVRAIAASWAPSRYRSRVRGAQELELLRECRSYHLGWLLYAAARLGRQDSGPTPRSSRACGP